jgi:endonuclease YncB( thermonuclease family)
MDISILVVAASLATQPIYGIAQAGDGDSLSVGGTSVRLFGIDAPEAGQMCTRGGSPWPCGQVAADHLRDMVTGREVRCIPTGRDDFDRTLARCSTITGVDINRVMVASGNAIAFRKYSTDFVSAEDTARNAKRGLWSGTFVMPSEVRAVAREAAQPRQLQRRRTTPVRAAARTSSGGCVIKGNHSPRGEFIYHLPGMPYYSRTRAEAMFCSEAQAQAAGFRRARVR